MKKEKNKGKYKVSNATLTSTISMSLVLFLIGLVALLLFAARDLSTFIKENISVTVLLEESITSEQTDRIERYLTNSKFTKEHVYISKEDALKEHIQTMGDDPEKYLGFNPLSASFEVNLKAEYANKDSVAVFEQKIKVFEGINRIAYQQDIITMVNDNITRISLILLVIATVLMLISITLMNNTIRLSIYANRFLINTMKLVGATPWFIRKPYVKRGLLNGLIAALISLGMLALLLVYIKNKIDINLFTLQNTTLFNVVALVIALGMIITALSSYTAVGKYLRMQTNEMYFV